MGWLGAAFSCRDTPSHLCETRGLNKDWGLDGHMKKSPVLVAAALLGLLAALLVLFYLSPFSEVEPSQLYEKLEGQGEDTQYPQLPLYGYPISGKGATVYFPFKMVDNEATRFCLYNTKKIEELCGMTVDQVLLEGSADFFHCTYVTLNKESGEVRSFVDVVKTSNEGGIASMMVWKSKLTDFSFKDTCTEAALATSGS
jgi:hypothetical protein